MVRFLLEAGADQVWMPNIFGHFVKYFWTLCQIFLLQEHKTDEMHTALMEASMDGHVEVARLLLDSGAQVSYSKIVLKIILLIEK